MSVIWEGHTTGDLARLASQAPVDVVVVEGDLVDDRTPLDAAAGAAMVVIGGRDLPTESLPAVVRTVDHDVDPASLSRAVVEVLQAAEARRAAAKAGSRRAPRRSGLALKAALLSGRERQVLAELQSGRTSREISERLGLSISTVNKHVQHILIKLGARNRTHAALLMPMQSMRLREAALIEQLLSGSVQATDCEVFAEAVTRGATELVGADQAALGWLRVNDHDISVLAGYARPGTFASEPDTVVMSLVAERGQGFVMGPLAVAARDEAPASSWVAFVPIVANGTVRGVLSVNSRRQRLGLDEMQALQTLVDAVAARLDALTGRSR